MYLDPLLTPAAHLLGSLQVNLVLEGARVSDQGRETLVVVPAVRVLLFEFVVVYQGLSFELQLLLVQQVGICGSLLIMEVDLLAHPR